MPPFPMFVYLKKYDTFSEYFAFVSQEKSSDIEITLDV